MDAFMDEIMLVLNIYAVDGQEMSNLMALSGLPGLLGFHCNEESQWFFNHIDYQKENYQLRPWCVYT